MTRRLTLFLLAAATVLAGAAAMVPLTARSACACTMKTLAYRAAMKSDLRNLVGAQEAFFADAGRFAAVDELVARNFFRFSSDVHLVESRVGDTTYTVRVRSEALADVTCELAVGDGGARDGEPICGRLPRERTHIRNGVIFLVLLSIALALHFGQAAAGTRGFISRRLLLVPLLAVAHPFWDVISGRVIDHCSLLDFDLIWLALAAVTAWYLHRGPHAPPAPGG